jgi:hypothetical protein
MRRPVWRIAPNQPPQQTGHAIDGTPKKEKGDSVLFREKKGLLN